ncbi:MAG: hypothetical protein AAFV33_02190 [Chloroflexota bacterium]
MFHIPYLDTNPIAQAEYRRLRHTNTLSRGHTVVFALVYLLIVLVAFSPYVYYITPRRVSWLAVIAIVVFGFQVYVTLRTAAVITSVPLPQTELLTITPMSRWRLVVGKWWGAFRTVWVWHLLTAIPKVGLSLGVMNYMHLQTVYTMPVFTNGTLRLLAFPYIYISHNYHARQIYPMGWIVVIVILFSLHFAIWDSTMFAAMATLVSSAYSNTLLTRLLIFRGVLFAFVILSNLTIGYIDHNYIRQYNIIPSYHILKQNEFIEECVEIFYKEYRDDCASWYVHKQYTRAMETHLIASNSFIDNGIMLHANMMRPIPYSKVSSSQCFWLELCEGTYDPWWYETLRISHLQFLLRHMASAAYGMFLHVMLTLGFLWLAARRHP